MKTKLCVLFLGILFFAGQAFAQNACDKSLPVASCIDQPHAGDKTVTGRAVTAKVAVAVNNLVVKSDVDVKKDGVFTLALSPLDEYSTVTVTPLDGSPIQVRVLRSSTCGVNATLPCINQTHVGDAKVFGKVSPGSKVGLEVNNVSKGNPPVTTDGSFTMDVPALKHGDTITLTQDPDTNPKTATNQAVPAPAATTGASSSLYTFGLVGFDASGSSGSGPSQQYFASFDVTAPLPFLGPHLCKKPEDRTHSLSQTCWVWLNPRISSAPSATTTTLSSITSPSSLSSGAGALTIGQITQTVEFHGAAEFTIGNQYLGRQFGSGNSWARFSASVIVGGGIITPLNPTSNAPEFALSNNLGQQFNANPSLAMQYPQLAMALCAYGFNGATNVTCPGTSSTTVKNVAFIPFSRSRFYRDYFAGLRLKSFYFTGDCKDKSNKESIDESKTSTCKIQDTYPGTLDLRFGQDEAVTAGHLSSFVLTMAGSYPLPGTNGALRIFGSTSLKLRGNRNTTTLALVPTATAVALSDPSVVIQSTPQADQDSYRLGIGVDLISIISKWYTAAQKSNTTNQ